MLEKLRQLLSPEYLVVSEPGPPGNLWPLYLALGLFFAAGLAASLWLFATANRHLQDRRICAWLALWPSLLGFATVIGRFLEWPGWSARIWPYSLALVILAVAALYLTWYRPIPPWVAAQLRVLALQHTSEKPHPRLPTRLSAWFLCGLTLHLVGIGLILGGKYQWPLWTAPLILLGILLCQMPFQGPYRLPSLMPLTPLFGAYAIVLLWLLYRAMGISVIGWQGLRFPDPMVSLFYVDAVILAAAVHTFLCHTQWVAARKKRRLPFWATATLPLLAAALGWTAIIYLSKPTHGATASDPYAYAQMGVDLVERGTFVHRFPLFEQVSHLPIPWAATQPVGYHLPHNELGDAPSVWATGASVLFGGGYLLLGEKGLYLTTPLVAIASLAATWALVHEALRSQSRAFRSVVATLTVALLATSPEHVDRLLVPMADAAAQLFTVLTLLFLLRGARLATAPRRSLVAFALAGLCFAWAYWTRHTQLVLLLPTFLALANLPRETSRLSSLLLPALAFSTAALVGALPDIAYRWRWFGSPFAPETTELHLMRIEHIAPVAWEMLRSALAAGEWGYLFPLALYGSYRLARDHTRESLLLAAAFGAVLLVHLTYSALRLRDLISLFPLLNLAVAYGAAQIVVRARSLLAAKSPTLQLGPHLGPAAAIGVILLSLALSRWAMIDNLWKPGWASFGYMTAEQRAAFDRLDELTPPDAVVATSLNAGAVVLYTGRDIIRPYEGWEQSQWDLFLHAMRAAHRPIYLLDDSRLMADFIARQGDSRLTPIEALDVPLFYAQDRDVGWLYRLEWKP
jgi:hypothetical protein